MTIYQRELWLAICCAAFMAAQSAHAAEILTFTSPLESHVFQRDKENQASVTISGGLAGAADIIEAKVDLVPGMNRGKAVAWTTIARGDEISEGKFSTQISIEAGGWYTLSVRALRGKEVVAESKIMKVGVGDVFITAGQSNSANFGRPKQVANDGRVVYFNGEGFVPARDPIPGGCGGGGSVWPILGDHIAISQQVPVCFRSASLTWTEVKNWMPPETPLYKNLAKCVAEFEKGGVRAVLWHQGESDSLAKTSAETYCVRLETIIGSLNKDAGYDIPWFVAQASFHPGSKEAEEKEVAKGQQLLWERDIAHVGPITDDLGKEYRSDGVHFNQLGLTTHGERWFTALSDAYGWEINQETPAPEVINLWPDGGAPVAPGEEEKANATITVYRPSKPSGTAMVICPGGGYGGIVGAEGAPIASWLNDNGIVGIVLRYRLPRGKPYRPLYDAQRAIRAARSRAGAWGVDPERIGIIGFSAGGHLASSAATKFDLGDAKAEDPLSRISCRPDFAILVYPVISMGPDTHRGSKRNLLGAEPTEEMAKLFSGELQVTEETPPTFLTHAADDRVVAPNNSKLFYDALVAHKVPGRYLPLPSGGHGLNGYKGPMWDAWQSQSMQWIRELHEVEE